MEEKPTIIKSSIPESNTGRSDKSVMRKIILPIFILIIAVEIAFGAKTLLSPIRTGIVGGTKAQALSDGKITLYSASSSYGVGQTGFVAVRVSTGGHLTDGTDVYLQYDPSYLDVSPTSSFSKGGIYGEYPVVSVDTKQGIVRVSGIASLAQGGFSGLGQLGSLSFKVKKPGATTITAQYQPGATTYSNIIEATTAKNLLTASSAIALTLVAKPVSITLSPSPVCSMRVLQLCVDSTGKTGTQWCTSSNDPYSCNIGCYKEQYGMEQGCSVISNAK